MKATTMAGMVAGSVMGVALGAGLMMMPQGKQMKRALTKGASQMQKHLNDWKK